MDDKNKLEAAVGGVFNKGPSFEYPVINYSPRSPSRQYNLFESQSSPSKWKALGSVITNKFNQKLPIKDMIESTHMKDKVFDKIMTKLSTGKKLKRYDIYLEEEVGRH